MVNLWYKSWGKNYPDMLTYHLSVTFEMISSGVSSVAQSFPRFSPCPFNSTSSVWASFPWDAILSAVDCASLFSSELRVNSGELCILRYLLCSFKPTWRKSVTAKVEAFSLCLKKNWISFFSVSFPSLVQLQICMQIKLGDTGSQIAGSENSAQTPRFRALVGVMMSHSDKTLNFLAGFSFLTVSWTGCCVLTSA